MHGIINKIYLLSVVQPFCQLTMISSMVWLVLADLGIKASLITTPLLLQEQFVLHFCSMFLTQTHTHTKKGSSSYEQKEKGFLTTALKLTAGK